MAPPSGAAHRIAVPDAREPRRPRPARRRRSDVLAPRPLTFGLPGGTGAARGVDRERRERSTRSTGSSSALAAVVFVLIEVTLIAFVFRYRRRRRDAGRTSRARRSTGTRGSRSSGRSSRRSSSSSSRSSRSRRCPTSRRSPEAGEDVVTIEVTAHQFYWQYELRERRALVRHALPPRRPQGARSSSTPRTWTTRWWVPELTGKRDAIPGQTNELHFTPRGGRVFDERRLRRVLRHPARAHDDAASRSSPQDEFDAWLEENAPGSADDVALGEQRSGRRPARSATASTGEGDIGPAIARQRHAHEPRGARRRSSRRARTCRREPGLHAAGRARAGRTSRSTRSSPTSSRTSSSRAGRGRRWPLTRRPPGAPRLEGGPRRLAG